MLFVVAIRRRIVVATTFSVVGPRAIQIYEGAGGRTITDENIQSVWDDNRGAFVCLVGSNVR